MQRLFQQTSLFSLCFSALLISISCQKIKIEDIPAQAITDFNPQNTVQKENILNYLDWVESQDQLLVGQNIGHADGSLDFSLYQDLEYQPAILGFDLGYDDLNVSNSALTSLIKEHAQAKGLVTISTHMPNPFNRKPVDNKNKVDLETLYAGKETQKERFDQILVNIGNFLQELKEEEITVLFRPLHEMNGGWFWWGNDKEWPQSDHFVRLWQYVHDYLEVDRQLDNLLWVYAPNFQEKAEQKSALHYYPGDDFVDIVALDYYWDDLSKINDFQSLDLLKTLDKPIGLAEIGSKSIRDGSFDNLTYLGLKDLGGISYFVAWHSYPDNDLALKDNQNANAILDHNTTINLDEVDY